MKRFLQLVIFLFGVVAIAALDIAFFPLMGETLATMNIALIVSVFLLVIIDEPLAFWVYGISVFLMYLTSSTFLILPLLIGISTLGMIEMLFESFFTNRSYYSLILLGALAWIIYYLLYLLAMVFFQITDLLPTYFIFSWNWAFHWFIGLVVMMLLYSVAYMFTNYISKRFQSFFILTDR